MPQRGCAWLVLAGLVAACGSGDRRPLPAAIDIHETTTAPDVPTVADVDAGADTFVPKDEAAPDQTAFDAVPDSAQSGDAAIAPDGGDETTDSGGDAASADNADAADAMVEPTAPSLAPDDCPDLPALCAAAGGSVGELPKLGEAVPGWSAALPSAWSRWRPVHIELVGQHTVRIHATWFNQRYVGSVMENGVAFDNPVYIPFCAAVKPSLLPTGCVTIDISTQSNVVTKFQFEVMPWNDWPPLIGSKSTDPPPLAVPPALYCGVWSDEAAGLPLSATTSDGATVIAYPGRASLHLLADDAYADVSTLVTDALGQGPTPVVQILSPGGAAPTGVAVDVAVCRATAAQIEDSGCACPTAASPPADVTPSTDYLRVQWPGGAVVLTHAFLSTVEPVGWDGVGVPKGYDGGKGLCSDSYPIEAPDWECGGNAAPVAPYWAWPTVGQVYIRAHHERATLMLHEQPQKVGPKPPWATLVSMSPGNFNYGYVFMGFDLYVTDSLAVRSLPARKREGAMVWIQQKPNPLQTLAVPAITAYTSTLIATDPKAVVCPVHVPPWLFLKKSPGTSTCKEVEIKVDAALSTWHGN